MRIKLNLHAIENSKVINNWLYAGGKLACPSLLAAPSCVVYSLGSHLDYSFEEDILRRTACHVVTFDCTVDGSSIHSRHTFVKKCFGRQDSLKVRLKRNHCEEFPYLAQYALMLFPYIDKCSFILTAEKSTRMDDFRISYGWARSQINNLFEDWHRGFGIWYARRIHKRRSNDNAINDLDWASLRWHILWHGQLPRPSQRENSFLADAWGNNIARNDVIYDSFSSIRVCHSLKGR